MAHPLGDGLDEGAYSRPQYRPVSKPLTIEHVQKIQERLHSEEDSSSLAHFKETAFSQPEPKPMPPNKAASKICVECKQEYEPTCNAQSRCPECGKKRASLKRESRKNDAERSHQAKVTSPALKPEQQTKTALISHNDFNDLIVSMQTIARITGKKEFEFIMQGVQFSAKVV